MLSAIPNERPGGSLAVFPGTGVFICDPAPPPQQGEPAVTCWLYSPASLPPPPPKAFCTLVSTLAPGDPAVCTPLFEHHSLAPGLRRGIPWGSHVCVHLNASLLPTPFLDRTETLSFLAVQNRGGLGASQYFHSFSDLGRQEPLSVISLSSHPPWIFLINFLPMKIGRTLPLFSLLPTLLLQTQMIFTSVCRARRKRRTPPLTTVSLFATNMRIVLILSTVPPLPLRTTTHRLTTVQYGNAPTLTTREVNTSLTCSHSFTPTGHPFGKLKVSRSRHSLIPFNMPTMMSPPPHSVGLRHGAFHHTHLLRTPFASCSPFFIRLPS